MSHYSRGYPIEYFQYDGVPIQTGGASWGQPDMLMFDRVELLRGAGGLFNGAGQPGGVINLVRKRPGMTPEVSALLGLGSWDHQRAEIDLSTPFNSHGSIRGRLAAAYDDRDSFIDHVHSQRTSLYTMIETDLTPHTTLSIGVGDQQRDWTPPFGGLPRYADGRDPGLPRSTFLASPWTFWDFETTQFFAELNHQINPDWRLKINAISDHETSDLKYAYSVGAIHPDTREGPMLMGGANAYNNKQRGLDVYLAGHFHAFGRKHDAIVGANGHDRDANSRNAMLPNLARIPINVFAPNPTAIPDPGEALWFSQSLTSTTQYGFYGSLRFKLTDPLTAIIGGRLSWWETRSWDLLTRTVTANHDETKHFTPYAGLVYALHQNWSIYASYADIFHAQSHLLDNDQHPLSPAKGVNYEAGLKGAFFQGALNTALAVFRVEETHRAVQISDLVIGGCCYASNGKVRSQGVDMEVSGRVLPSWQLSAGYTFNTSQYLRDRVNQGQSFRSASPKHLLRIWTSYQLPAALSAWSIGGGVNAQSGVYTEGGRPVVRAQQATYVIASVRAGYRFNPHWSMALNINNVFDRRYYARLGMPIFGPANLGNVYGEPRNATLTLRSTF